MNAVKVARFVLLSGSASWLIYGGLFIALLAAGYGWCLCLAVSKAVSWAVWLASLACQRQTRRLCRDSVRWALGR